MGAKSPTMNTIMRCVRCYHAAPVREFTRKPGGCKKCLGMQVSRPAGRHPRFGGRVWERLVKFPLLKRKGFTL